MSGTSVDPSTPSAGAGTALRSGLAPIRGIAFINIVH